MWKPDRSQESKKGQEIQGARGIKEEGVASLFPHQVIDFAPAHFALTLAPAQPVF